MRVGARGNDPSAADVEPVPDLHVSFPMGLLRAYLARYQGPLVTAYQFEAQWWLFAHDQGPQS